MAQGTAGADGPAHASDVVIVGAGVVGAACAYFATRAGLAVTVVDRGPVAGGTSGAGEGNILLSDKELGPELDLAVLSTRLWREIGDDLGAGAIELEPKGGLVVAGTSQTLAALGGLAALHRARGIEVAEVAGDELPVHEPHLSPGLMGGTFYPDDLQVQPMLATARLLERARRGGARVLPGVEVTGLLRGAGERVSGVRTARGDIAARSVVNATGIGAAELAARAGLALPIQPRRGFVLVTEPLPRVVRHKVYEASYLADVASDATSLSSSAVVEGTQSGNILIGASRERVGFDRRFSLPVLGRLADQAIALFPVLATVSVIRAYQGFRPYSPDHLPVIGPDPRAPGLLHACGHEGAGIGLAAATGHLITQALTDEPLDLDLTPFRPDRFEEVRSA